MHHKASSIVQTVHRLDVMFHIIAVAVVHRSVDITGLIFDLIDLGLGDFRWSRFGESSSPMLLGLDASEVFVEAPGART